MSLTKKINAYLSSNNLKRSDLARVSNIPYTTIDGLYKKGASNIKLSTLKKLAQTMNCTIDYLVSEELPDQADHAMNVSSKEMSMLKKYRILDDRGKKMAERIITYEYSMSKKDSVL